MTEELYTDALTLIILAGVFWWQVLSELTQPPPTGGRDRDLAPRAGTSLRDGPATADAVGESGAGTARAGAPSEGMHAISFQAGSEDLDADEFRKGACVAYEQIVTAFANGDLALLAQHLSPDVYEAFRRSILEREERGDRVERTFVSLPLPDILDARASSDAMQVTARFAAELVMATRDRAGKVIEGSARGIGCVTDVWTFSRDLSAGSKWKLVATESA